VTSTSRYWGPGHESAILLVTYIGSHWESENTCVRQVLFQCMKYRSGEGGVYLCHQITDVENQYRYVIPLCQWRKDRMGVYMSNQASHNLVWQVSTTELYASTMTSSNDTSIISRRFR
jgi:hypothetical protein